MQTHGRSHAHRQPVARTVFDSSVASLGLPVVAGTEALGEVCGVEGGWLMDDGLIAIGIGAVLVLFLVILAMLITWFDEKIRGQP